MSDEERLKPEEALGRLESEAKARPKLKIYFGMSAGVGKTYAMLKEAHLLAEQGLDLVIGWVESHGRAETDALLEGLALVPPKKVDYRGIAMSEMDLDAIIARRPAIVLVDELAHSNAPGSRHPKRYQDVLDLLEAGISVYTTVNIQHLESMADSVELVTFVPIRERVPDSVFDRADEMQMIDIPPHELIKRLDEGKVYTGEASRDAVRNFFTIGNLAVLREIALRQASQLASHQLFEIMHGDSTKRPSVSSQRILVAVSSSPNSESLIRWARRLTYTLKADWHCVNVESGVKLSESDKDRLQKNLDLARSLGARVEIVPSADMVSGIIGYARKQGISIIIVGKSGIAGGRGLFARRSMTERIIKESGDIAVFAIQEKVARGFVLSKAVRRLRSSPWWQYGAAIVAIGATTAIGLVLSGYSGYWAASILYLAAISLLALALDRKPVLLAAFLSALLWDFLFIPPRFTFTVNKPEDYLMLALYFLLAITSGWATTRLRANERMLLVREERMSLLRGLASELAGRSGMEDIVAVGVPFVERAFDAEAIVLFGKDKDELRLDPEGGWRALDEKAISAAAYCYRSGRSAGRHTSTLPAVEWHFVPMDTPNGTIGVIGLRQAQGMAWTDDNETFLRTLVRTLSLAVERELLSERNRANELNKESERISKLLLDSVSHELRTPLTVIKGSASALADEETARDAPTRRALIEEIVGASERLDAIVGNLLSMNRLESGPIALRRTEVDAEDLVAAALKAAGGDLAGHELVIDQVSIDAPVPCDAGLIVQTLVNLLRNAAAYSGAHSRIAVSASAERGWARFAVEDEGPGVREADMARLFDKFFRAERSAPGGTGLGLAICKGIVEAHGGHIEAHNLPGRGFAVSFTLPLEMPA
ncbi:MAG TPA: sensor histidine kinase KdpD [Rectinemataceae bacterium]|nr:sensor histidine kinase KdpD [Rectinemataceae bacterium]